MTVYYAMTDENRVLCVDQVDETSQDEASTRQLAVAYPDTIYFVVDNKVPEFRVPVSGNPVSEIPDTSNRKD